MPVYLCTWPERAALLLDDVSRASALEVATEVGEGETPQTIRELPPRFFAASVVWASDDDDDGDVSPEEDYLIIEMVVERSEEELARMIDEEPPVVLAPAPAPVDDGKCASEAEADGGVIVKCTRDRGHDGTHHANGLEWTT